MGEWFDSFSDLKSAGGDPMPLAPADTNSSGGYTNADGRPANVYTGVTDQLLVRGRSSLLFLAGSVVRVTGQLLVRGSWAGRAEKAWEARARLGRLDFQCIHVRMFHAGGAD